MTNRYELRKIWGIGPFKRKTELASFYTLYVAEHVMESKLLTAKRRGKRLVLEIYDHEEGKVIKRKSTR